MKFQNIEKYHLNKLSILSMFESHFFKKIIDFISLFSWEMNHLPISWEMNHQLSDDPFELEINIKLNIILLEGKQWLFLTFQVNVDEKDLCLRNNEETMGTRNTNREDGGEERTNVWKNNFFF